MTEPAPALSSLPLAQRAARLCHSAAFRVNPAPAVKTLEHHLTLVTAHHPSLGKAGSPPRLWVEDVPDAPDSELGRRRRATELHRPLAPGRSPLRVVLLRYDDGSAALILVAHRAWTGRPLLAPLARSVLTGADLTPPPEAPAADLDELAASARTPDLPQPAHTDADHADHGPYVVRGFNLPEAAEVSFDQVHAALVGALGLTLARHAGSDRALIGTTVSRTADGMAHAEALTAVSVRAEADTTVAEHLTDIRDRLTRAVPWLATGEPALPDVLCAPAGVIVGRRDEDAYVPHLAPLYPLTLTVGLGSDGSLLTECHHRLDPDAVADLLRHTAHVADQLLTGPGTRPLQQVELLDEAERGRVARLGRPRRTVAPPQDCVHDAVAARAADHPERIAVVGEETSLSYGELDERADAIAAGLRVLGVTTGARVGVCLPPSPELVATMLGILRSGAAYVPLHPSYPAERIRTTLDDAEAALLVAAPADEPYDVPVQTVDALVAAGRGRPVEPGRVAPRDPAYVIYTSGSTGRPKGVVVPHRNVLALVAATEDDFSLSTDDVWSFFHSPAFDFSVWEIWGCLLTGGRLVVVPHLVARSPSAFHALLARTGVTVLSQTPSALTHLIDHDHAHPAPLAVRLMVLGGEPLDPRILLRWFDQHPDGDCQVVNMFGITETTVHVTAHRLRRQDTLAGSRSVGRPLPGWYVHVRDEHGRLLPPGAPGEIWVGGAGVADGYLNRPELTGERFVADPLGPGRMYRSGDRGRLLRDGRLEHLGRLDDQVKLRGHRIEPEEIRAALLADPAVTAATVVLRRGTEADSARLDAYVVADAPTASSEATGKEVRRRVARILPDYLVPATVTAVPALPLTANGKLDVERLPEPAAVPAEPELPADAGVEEAVRAAWASVLRTSVEPDDNFFDLGGNSLNAIRLLSVMAERGLELAPDQLYRHPTVRGLAAALRAQGQPE